MTREFSPEELYPSGESGLEVHWLEVSGGLRIRTVQAGPKSGPAVVFVPGWACTAYTFRKNMPAFATAGYRAISVELAGQGMSGKPREKEVYTLPWMSAHLLDVMDALSMDRAVLIGNSLGTAYAMHAALRAPDRVNALGLWSPIGLADSLILKMLHMAPAALAPLLDPLSGRWTVAMMVHFIYGPGFTPDAHDIDEYWAPTIDPAFYPSLLWLLRGVNWSAFSDDELKRLTMPVQVVMGTTDPIVPLREVVRRAELLPNGRVEKIPRIGHATQETAWERTNSVTLEMLEARGLAPRE
jgi:pimeloyl-ACP methyl ester carboxylesterase